MPTNPTAILDREAMQHLDAWLQQDVVPALRDQMREHILTALACKPELMDRNLMYLELANIGAWLLYRKRNHYGTRTAGKLYRERIGERQYLVIHEVKEVKT